MDKPSAYSQKSEKKIFQSQVNLPSSIVIKESNVQIKPEKIPDKKENKKKVIKKNPEKIKINLKEIQESKENHKKINNKKKAKSKDRVKKIKIKKVEEKKIEKNSEPKVKVNEIFCDYSVSNHDQSQIDPAIDHGSRLTPVNKAG